MRHTLAAFLFALHVFAAAAAPALAESGVPEIDNPATPADGVQQMTLVEQWRVGGDDDEIFFGSIAGLTLDAAGNLYVLDGQQSHVQVYAPDGAWLRTLGRRGEGPGEVDAPDGILLDQQGRIGMFQAPMGRIVRLNPDSTPAGDLTYTSDDGRHGAVTILLDGQAAGDGLVIAGMHLSFSDDGKSTRYYFLALCDAAANRVRPLLEKNEQLDYTDFRLDEASRDFPWNRWAADGAGRVYFAAERNDYAIAVHAPDGTLERVFRRDYESLPRDDALTRRAVLVTEGVAKYHGTPLQGLTIEDTEPDIKAMWATAEGHLFVRTSRGDQERPAGCYTVLDEFAPDGRFVRQIAVGGDADPLRDSMSILPDGRVVIIHGALDAWLTQQSVDQGESADEEEAPLEIAVYRLE